jgi:2-polyprenyl-3-methyl-5-hydroxy-6-metoxy-1,4-benzoquinol methylase/regulator of replication initiation timing
MESIYESQVDPLRPNDAHGISLQLVGQGKTVLELGAASGHVTKALKALNNTVTAVERDARFSKNLSEIADDVIITDLDWLDLRERLSGKKFEVVLAGDVLEHCSKPELVLLQIHDLLTPDGYVVISLPNIAHGDVRLSLLTGTFDYSDTGLLDRTHLRFFTRSSIHTFLSQSHFQVDAIFGSTASIGTTEFGPPKAGVPAEAIEFVQKDPDALVYQFIVKALPENFERSTTTQVRPEHSGNAQVDELLAAVCLYQDAIAQSNETNARDSQLLFDALSHVKTLEENFDTKLRELTTSQHENNTLLHENNTLQHENNLLRQDLTTSQHETNTLRHELNLLRVRAHEQEQDVIRYKHAMEVEITKRQEANLAFLDARDHAIGSAAELGELRYRHDKSLREIDSLVHQLNLIHGSRTWRIGRFVLLPLTTIRKVLRLILK